MTSFKPMPRDIATPIRRPLALTRGGMVAERLVRAFWPLWSVLFVVLAFLMMGAQDHVGVEVVWVSGVVALLAAGWALVRGARAFRWPSRDEAVARLDATMAGRPIQAALDDQAVGAGDAASAAVWAAHQRRMRDRLAAAEPVAPDLRVARADPFALRYVAVLALAVAALFGSIWSVQSVTAMGPSGDGLASGPTWEGWVEPPRYTGLPSLYLNDIEAASLEVPQGSAVTLRLYGEVGALRVSESVSGRVDPLAGTEADPGAEGDATTAATDAADGDGDIAADLASQTAQSFTATQSGRIEIAGPGGRGWDIAIRADTPPVVSRSGEFSSSYEGEASLPFAASDDHGVIAGSATITLALDEIERRYGLARDPEPRATLSVPLPMPIAGNRREFEEVMIENFSEHPWANLPVTVTLDVVDAADQAGRSAPEVVTLPGRRFFDPMASAVIEQRRDLLWSRENAPRVGQVMRALSYLPDDIFRSATTYLRFRTIVRRIETFAEFGITDAQQEELAQALWDLAILLEEGDLDDALERLRRAQDRLAEAMKNGASDQEIAELMQELRDATDDYMRQLSRQAQQEAERNGDQQAQQQQQDGMQMSQDDLQRMMDRIQELMEQGRMAEAQEALDQLRQMMENMRVTQGQGQGQPSPGQQAMDGLAETLREQQGLSDQAFRDLQEQFNPDAGQGESQDNEGRDGGQGRGQQHSQQGQGQQQGQQQGQGQQPGQQGQPQGQGQQQGQGQGQQQGQQGQGGGQDGLEEGLANRQQALRQELNRQRQNLPGAGSEAGEAAREALGRAEGAMEGAEDALRRDDLAEAIDQQSEAMEALREGMRNLGEALAEEQQNQGQQGTADGGDPGQQRDPLGRSAGATGQVGTDEQLLQGTDVYRRARELLDEIRRRSGEGERPDVELEYLERLLDRF